MAFLECAKNVKIPYLEKEDKMEWLIALLYFFPSLVAAYRKYRAGIWLLNLFLGWTGLGWLVSLIWAVSSPKVS